MNVLFIINSLEIGGAETFLLRLIKELKHWEVKPFLYILNSEKNDTAFATYFLSESGATLIPAFKKDSNTKKFFLEKINGLSKRILGVTFYEQLTKANEARYFKNTLLHKYNIELLNSHLFAADLFAASYLKPLVNLPLVATFQGCYNDLNDLRSASIVIKQLDGFTYVAEKNLSIFERTKLPIPSINKLVYNGLPRNNNSNQKNRIEFGLSQTDFVVGQISRSIPSKGMEIAIKSIILLVETHKLSNLKLMLVGPETEYYEDLKRKYADKDYILFPGAAISPTDWVPLFDIGILPSFFPSESCPSSIVEYLSCGKPAIASAIGEIPNMIRHNNLLGGIIVKEKDELGQPSAEFFASAILSYYNDKNKLQSDSTTALLAFEKFLIEKSAKEYITVFKDVILNNN